MMTVSFFDELDSLVARFTVKATDSEEAVRLAICKYKATPNAEFKPVCDIPCIMVAPC